MAKSTKTTYINTELDYNWAWFSGIYKITNTINGKFYIGSARSLYKRLSEHQEKLKKNKHKNPHLQNSYNKYGNVFSFEIIKMCNIEELFIVEQYYLDILNPEYNINKQATGRHIPHTLETRKKIANSQLIKIDQYNLNNEFLKTWESIKSIRDHFGMKSSGQIVSHLKGVGLTCRKFVFKYHGS
jgi:group I intron endonuclease